MFHGSASDTASQSHFREKLCYKAPRSDGARTSPGGPGVHGVADAGAQPQTRAPMSGAGLTQNQSAALAPRYVQHAPGMRDCKTRCFLPGMRGTLSCARTPALSVPPCLPHFPSLFLAPSPPPLPSQSPPNQMCPQTNRFAPTLLLSPDTFCPTLTQHTPGHPP